MAAPLGNTNASSAKKWQAALERAIVAYPNAIDETNCTPIMIGLNRAASAFVIKMMEESSINFFREFGDRLDGKSVQGMEVSGNEGGAIILQLTTSDANL
jgi:hypothetical protein